MFVSIWAAYDLAWNACQHFQDFIPWAKSESPPLGGVGDDLIVSGGFQGAEVEHNILELPRDDDSAGEYHTKYVTKSCNLIYDHNGTMAEPYLLSHPKLLKPLQGISVPHLLRRRTSRNGNWVTYDLETYGSLRQRLLYGPLSEDEKQLIVDAYEDIHQRGILHGEVSFDNVLIDDLGNPRITEFSQGCCLASMDDPDIQMELRCEPCELEYERRHVRFLLDYKDSRRSEYMLTRAVTSNWSSPLKPYLGLGFRPEHPFYIPRHTLDRWLVEAISAAMPWGVSDSSTSLDEAILDARAYCDGTITGPSTIHPENSSHAAIPDSSAAALPFFSSNSSPHYTLSAPTHPLLRKRSFSDTPVSPIRKRLCRRRTISLDDMVWRTRYSDDLDNIPPPPCSPSTASSVYQSSYDEEITNYTYRSLTPYPSACKDVDADIGVFGTADADGLLLWRSPTPPDEKVASDDAGHYFTVSSDESDDEMEDPSRESVHGDIDDEITVYSSSPKNTHLSLEDEPGPSSGRRHAGLESDEESVSADVTDSDYASSHTDTQPSVLSTNHQTVFHLPTEAVHGTKTATWYHGPDGTSEQANFEPMTVTLLDASLEPFPRRLRRRARSGTARKTSKSRRRVQSSPEDR